MKIINFKTIIIVLLVCFILLALVYNYNTNKITNLLTGKVAVTSNVLNENTSEITASTISKINLLLILVLFVILFVFAKHFKNITTKDNYSNKN
jgi:hypothetical protein